MTLAGKHLTVDMYGCKYDDLKNIDFLKQAMTAAAAEADLTVIKFSYHKFESRGLAALALLNESHMSVHAYPELGFAAVDIFSCHDKCQPEKAIAMLKQFLKPAKTKTTHIKRGDFGSVSDMKPRIKVSATPLRRVRDTGAKVLRFLYRSK